MLPDKANPSEGVDDPLLGFCMTPLILNIICCALLGAFVIVKSCTLPLNAGLSVDIKKLPTDCASSKAFDVELKTNNF